MKLRITLSMMLAAIVASTGCVLPKAHNLPPAQQLLEPGPGVGGPGPGVLMPSAPPGVMPVQRPDVQILFVKPEAMQVRWDTTGQGMFDSEPLVVPGRHNFPQDGIYRLKITNIAGREGVELYPTIEVGPTTPRTEAFLAHNAIPIQLTDEDFGQVLAGNFVTKVIYLPDPEFQELALAGVETLVSTKLDPGQDPITEADRRGSIMSIIRLGNKDVELPGTAPDHGFAGVIGGYGGNCGPEGCGPGGNCGHGGNGGYGPGGIGSLPPQFVAGVTAPQYGMPMSGTPIGLPGPPHIPLGGPAGLQQHVMRNHTKMHLPEPTDKLKIHVKQEPGFSYPRPPSRAFIKEQSIHATPVYQQPRAYKHENHSTGNSTAPLRYGARGVSGTDCEDCQQ
jgi:hypothetical protein